MRNRHLQETPAPEPTRVLWLENGDRLSQAEFHRRYQAMPDDVRAELIGGTVYMASALRMPHGRRTRILSAILDSYENSTPGVDGADNATAILGKNSEPQPDLSLRLLSECGGQSHVNEKGYLVGAPELIIEVAHSTEAIDLYDKKDDYRKAGVLEYLVFCVEQRELRAFDLQVNRPWPALDDGIFRSVVFPGLWIDFSAVLAAERSKAHRTAHKGLRSPEHAVFVRKMKSLLTKAKKRKK